MITVSAASMRELDQRTIAAGTPGLELMERAGNGAVAVIRELHPRPCPIAILAGKGNNGGDGFVVGRVLAQAGYAVSIILLCDPSSLTGDALQTYQRLDSTLVHQVSSENAVHGVQGILHNAHLIVDALLGTGLQAPVTGLYRDAIDLLSTIPPERILSLDIPSGVNATSGAIHGCAVRAGTTVTFGLPKSGLFWYPGATYAGTVITVPIGIPEHYQRQVPHVVFMDQATIAPLLRTRPIDSHKGTFGHLLLVAGSIGKSGAAALAAGAAVRGGAGLVTAAVPRAIHQVMEVKTTEAMTVPLPGDEFLTESALPQIQQLCQSKSALAIGPGIGLDPETSRLVRDIITTIPIPMVLDADAISALSGLSCQGGVNTAAPLVITPHPGELSRLVGTAIPHDDAGRYDCARTTAQRLGVTVVLKGAHTVIASPDGRAAVNLSGNQGMASGGMGDLLTGLLGALLAQGYQPFDAACIAVYVHGAAADQVAIQQGMWGMAASDLLSRIPTVFQNLTTY